jgi:RNA polymerase sigma-70 factor, ECF subfamily
LGIPHVFLSHAGGFPTLPFDIEDYYERYGPMVLRRCRSLLHDDAQAQDALQDVFVALLRHHDRLHDEAPAALLLRIATNTCLNRLRSLRCRAEDGDDERLSRIASTANAEGEGRTLARDLLRRLFRADDPLAASSQTIAVMHLVDGMTLEEVARDAGLSVSGVRKRLRSVRARLVQLEGGVPT